MIFILWRVGWMATVMYVPSLAVNAASGGQVDLTTMTIIVGVLVTLYTMLGGIQAVIWNDVIQFCIMFGGLAATVAICWFSVPGGLGEIWSVSASAGLLNPWLPLTDPAVSGVVASVVSFFQQPMNAIALLVALIVGRAAQYTSDLYNRVWLGADLRGASRSPDEERSQVRVSRILTLFFGALGTVLVCNVSRIGPLIEINAKVVNAFTGPLCGIFLLAMFSRRARSEGVLIAGAAGAWAAYYVAYESRLGFMWPSTFGLVATLAAGMLVAVVWPARSDDARADLTWRAVMNRPGVAR